MNNYKNFITANPEELAKLLCYYSSTAGDCAGCEGNCIYNKEICAKEVRSWLTGKEDETFWEGFERWKKQNNL